MAEPRLLRRLVLAMALGTAGAISVHGGERPTGGDPPQRPQSPRSAETPHPPEKPAGGDKEDNATKGLSIRIDFDLPKRQSDMAIKTLGGRQFWGDVHYFHGWKIQRNVFTGHYRLLDGSDYRHTWGTREECLAKLEEIKAADKLPPMKGKAVIALHGIVRSSKSMAGMKAGLEQAGYQVFLFDYPSTQISIPEAAEYLESCLKSLDGIKEINFVVHSMGGLVVRSYLAAHPEDRDKRINRMVMLGVPNGGAELADMLKTNFLFKAIYGPAGQQLGTEKDGLIAKLPTPDFEFAVIAGARGTPDGFNPLIPGDDDGTVCVESTRLAGAADFGTVKCLHSLLMNDPAVIDQTVRFLQEGRLREKGDRQPIPKPEPMAATQ